MWSFTYRRLAVVASAAAVLFLGPGAGADSIFLSTPSGSVDAAGEPVTATAHVVTAMNAVTVTLQNLTVNPRSIGQNISDFGFHLTNGITAATLTSSSGKERTVADDGTFTNGGTVSTGWVLDGDFPGFIHLNVLGTPEAPQHTILGAPDASNVYSNAKDSIAKTGGPHNPFLAGPVSFTLSVPGVTSATSVVLTDAFFSFGTTAGNNVTAVPAPAAALGGLVLIGGLALRRALLRKS